MNKIKKPIILIFFIIMLYTLVFFITNSNNNKKNDIQFIKTCIASMKTIEGAAKLYQDENGDITSLTVNNLVTKGYLKYEFKCHNQLNSFMGMPTPIEPLPFKIIINIDPKLGKSSIDVECQRHGKLSNVKNIYKSLE
jgi:competence protein ComGC